MELERFPDRDGVAEETAPRPLDVLVVDDDPIVSRVMLTMLKAAGIGAESVSGGRDALARIQQQQFDVIVSDVDMPGGGGLELLRAVRAIDLDLPIILVTGVPDVRSAAKALEYGAFRYLMKPIDFASLIDNVRKAARGHALAVLRRQAVSASGQDAQQAGDLAGLEAQFAGAHESLWMAYQPIMGARSGALFGVEALMRSEEKSLPHPGAVLDAATRLGKLRDLGRKVRRIATDAAARGPAGMFLFVNLHPDDLADDDLIDPDAALTKVASHVVLEITERSSLPSTPALQARLAELRELGYRLAIDDIGAGYSGLTTFADVTPEVVKIDMSLVRNVHQSVIRQRTIRSLCSLCHETGTLVVGEGVETAEERDCLLELGCDLFQGYLFGRPARDLPRWRSAETLAVINTTGQP